MSESVDIPNTEPTGLSVSNKNDKKDNEVTSERQVPVKDRPVAGESASMPPLVVKQIGVQKPGVTPTAGSVSFDYTGPPVKVTNSTVTDLVNQFGIQNAWLAVLKLSGYNVTKEGGESILPIKRFRERVRKLKQTVETLKSRSDDSTTYLSKEFLPQLNVPAEGNTDQNNSKVYSHTDAVIESILRQAVTENNTAQSSSTSTTVQPTTNNQKPKRAKKKNKADVPNTTAASTSTAQPRATSATIDDVVSSVMDKIRNNVPFDSELNIDLPTSPPTQPQPQVLYTPQITPGQTFVMLQDDQMIPIVPQTVSQIQPAKSKSKKKGKANQLPQPSQIVQFPNYPPQQSSTIRTATSTSMPQHITVFTLPRAQTTSTAPSNYPGAPSYTTSAGNNPPMIFSNLNDIVRSPGIPTSNGPITKVVTYQTNNQYPQQFIAGTSPQGISPNAINATNSQGQYIMQATVPTPKSSAKTSQMNSPPIQNQVETPNKKSPRRKAEKNKKSDAFLLENFNESDFEEFATPKRKEAIKKLTKKKEPKPKISKKSPKIEKPTKKAAKEKTTKTTKQKQKQVVKSDTEEEVEDVEEDEPIKSTSNDKKDNEVAQLKRQLQAERSRHYTQKRRATKLDDDYKRVLDRLQQTELNLAIQMSECERLQGEMKKLKLENEELQDQLNGDSVKKPIKNNRGPQKKVQEKKKSKEVTPPPLPVSSPINTKKSEKTTKKGVVQNKTTNNRKRGRPAAVPSPDVEDPSPPVSADANKVTFNPDDFIPRRAAASKRIRYF